MNGSKKAGVLRDSSRVPNIVYDAHHHLTLLIVRHPERKSKRGGYKPLIQLLKLRWVPHFMILQKHAARTTFTL